MRYLILILVNLPIVLLAIVNIITKYKTHKITFRRFRIQVLFWVGLLVCIVISFPLYNYLLGNRVFSSDSLTILDIVQTTAIIYLIYVVTSLRQSIEQSEKRLRDLHQELSIKLSNKN